MRLNRLNPLTAVVASLLLSMPWTIIHAETLKLVTGNDYLPYSDEKLPGGGLATTIVLEVLKHANIDHHAPEFKPWARGLMETELRVYDATFPYARTSDREQVLLYSEPFLSVTDTFFVYGDFPDTILTPAHFQNKVICRPQGYSQATLQALRQDVSFDIESPRTAAQCVSMLRRGHVDFFFINELAGRHLIDAQKERYGSEFQSVPMPDRIGKIELHMVMSRNNPLAEAVIEQFNASLREMKANGEIGKIVDQHLQNHLPGP